MFGSVALEVMIGLVGVFLVFSLIVSGVREVIAKALQTRSKHLWAKLSQLLDSQASGNPQNGSFRQAMTIGDTRPIPSACNNSLSERLARHPFIRPIDDVTVPNKKVKIHRISSSAFSRSLLDLLAEDSPPGTTMTRINTGIQELSTVSPRLYRQLTALIDQGADDVEKLREAVSNWYDTQMESLSALYRRRTRWVSLFIGVIIALLFNVNAVETASELWQNTTLREAAVNIATDQVSEDLTTSLACADVDDFLACVEDEASRLIDVGLPFGWQCSTPGACETLTAQIGDAWSQTFVGDPTQVLVRLGGLLAAAGAFAVGATFWYDLLKRLVSIRGTGSGQTPSGR